MSKLMVVPSKQHLLRDAKPLEKINQNSSIDTLVVDRAIGKEFAEALRQQRFRLLFVEPTDYNSFCIIALDRNGDYCGAFRDADWPTS